MKKGKILKTLAIAGTCLCAPLIFVGCGKDDSPTYTINYDYNIDFEVNEYFNNYSLSQKGSEGSTIKNMPSPKSELDIFEGWFIEGTNTEFTQNDKVNSDINLVAKWAFEDFEFSLNCTNFTYNSSLGGYSCEIDKGEELVIVPSKHNGSQGLLPVVKICEISDSQYSTSNVAPLEKIILTNSIKEIGSRTFAYCSGLNNVNLKENLLTIGENAFYGCDSLETLYFPNSLNYIGERAFYSCDLLNNVQLKRNLLSLGKLAFGSCKSLSNITIENGLTKLESGVFSGCSALESFELPESITEIHYSAFEGCESLAYLSVNINNNVFDSRNNCNAIINTSTNELIVGAINTIIPSSVTRIGQRAFSDRQIEEIKITQNIINIGSYAFNRCENLQSLIFDTTEAAIYYNAFSDCDALTTVYFKTGLTLEDSEVSDGYISTAWKFRDYTKQTTSDKMGYDMYVKNAE